MEEKLKKLDYESELDYICRICDNKDLYNLTWKEIGSIINDQLNRSCDESTYRKKFQAAKRIIEKEAVEESDEPDILDQLESKKLELREEIAKLRTLRLDDNRKIREQARTELYFEELKAAIENKYNDSNHIVRIKELDRENSDEYVLCFSDVHFGKEFTSITNVYDMSVAYARFERLLNEVVAEVKARNIKTKIWKK